MISSMTATTRSIEADRDTFDEIDLREIVIDSVTSFGPTAAAHEVSMQTTALHELPIRADGFRLRQVVDNLVSNAIKYTPPPGEVRITAELHDDAVSLVVADTGIGVSKDDLPKLLDPYFRTSAAKEKANGTGLGLGITNQIIAAHGGTLTIDSEPGVGTTVTVTLPISTAPQTPPPGTTSASASTGSAS
jgi:signal transduction histidine kinase